MPKEYTMKTSIVVTYLWCAVWSMEKIEVKGKSKKGGKYRNQENSNMSCKKMRKKRM